MASFESLHNACFAFVDQDGGKQAFSLEQTQRAMDATVAWLEQNGRADKRALAVDLPNCPEEEIDLLLEYTLAGTIYMISRRLQNPGKASVFQLAHLVYDFSIQDLKQRTDA